MKRFINYVFISSLLMFISILNVNAECSYKERKSMLDSAKSTDVSFSIKETEMETEGLHPITDEIEMYKYTKFSYELNVINLRNDLYIKISNDFNDEIITINYEDLVDGVFKKEIDDVSNIINYTIDFYSSNNNCYGNKVTTKKLKKGKYNFVSEFEICNNDVVKEHEYCKKFIDKDFGMSEFETSEKLNQILSNYEEKKNDKGTNNFLNFIKNNWLLLLVVCVFILLIVFISIKTLKKREEL